jgi:2-iminoacetate synthase
MTLQLLQKEILKALEFNFSAVTPRLVEKVLTKDYLEPFDLGVLLSPAAEKYLDQMAVLARDKTRCFFGRNINLFTPLYLANYCLNQCIYCGYNQTNDLRRGVLSPQEIDQELLAIKNMGLEDILLLTGESRGKSGPAYIALAVQKAARLFTAVGLEVYPLKTPEYEKMKQAGADYVCVYQETYDPLLYDRVHLKGPKKHYLYRLEAQSRALTAGIRAVSIGSLLGLGDFRRDTLALGVHGRYLTHKFPASEISYSVPRLRPICGTLGRFTEVTEKNLTQVILALRLFSPSFGLTLSTRERAFYRDQLMGLGITRLSAGVQTSVGGHDGPDHGDDQFIKSDCRGVREVCQAITAKGLQPVFTDYARL